MLKQLPEHMGGMTALRKLQISGNSLSVLPESIGNLTRLEVGQCSRTLTCLSQGHSVLNILMAVRQPCLLCECVAAADAGRGAWQLII